MPEMRTVAIEGPVAWHLSVSLSGTRHVKPVKNFLLNNENNWCKIIYTFLGYRNFCVGVFFLGIILYFCRGKIATNTVVETYPWQPELPWLSLLAKEQYMS